MDRITLASLSSRRDWAADASARAAAHFTDGPGQSWGGGRSSSARVAQLALVHVGRVLGVVCWLGGRGIGGDFFWRWQRPTGVGALACRSGRDPTINMRWKGGGERQ